MANYVQNVLHVHGSHDEIESFLRNAKAAVARNREFGRCSPEFTFNMAVQMPPELLTGSAWEEWRNKHWGTKWDATDCERWELQHGCARIEFLTANAPPLPVIIELARIYKALQFTIDFTEEFSLTRWSLTYSWIKKFREVGVEWEREARSEMPVRLSEFSFSDCN
jgi:hypothetical protein